MPRICDYEGSRYRTDFWENQNRAYEDGVERVAIKQMLPPSGGRLIEIGAGFGRLVDLYQGYRQIVLLDYARTQLEEAQRYLGHDPRFIFVVADVYNLPFVDNLFDSLTMVRVMHHLTDVPAALPELRRIIRPNGVAIIEYASKRNLKAILRWLLRRQTWSPFAPEPVEFVELNFNFHPGWMRQQFEAAALPIENIRTVSHYRVDLLKRLLPTQLLVTMDSLAQRTGNWWQLTPSLFLQARARKATSIPPAAGFFCCPACGAAMLALDRALAPDDYVLTCRACQTRWGYQNGIYDFKTPLNLTAYVEK